MDATTEIRLRALRAEMESQALEMGLAYSRFHPIDGNDFAILMTALDEARKESERLDWVIANLDPWPLPSSAFATDPRAAIDAAMAMDAVTKDGAR